jgi:hypothetical protein
VTNAKFKQVSILRYDWMRIQGFYSKIINIIEVDSDAQALVLKFEVSSQKGKNLDNYIR